MRIALAYNEIDSISGETAFFDGMRAYLGRKGIEADFCPVPASGLPMLDTYLRYPLLIEAAKRLRGFRGHDIVHLMNSALAPAGAALRGPRTVASVHHFVPSYLEASPAGNPLLRACESAYGSYVAMLERGSFARMDALVAASPFMSSELERRYSLDPSKLSAIVPGVDAAAFRKARRTDLRSRLSAEEVVVFTGRLHEKSKGLSYLLRAMAHLEGVKLLVIGDGPDRAMYERLSSSPGIAGKVVFAGRLGTDAKCSIQKSASVSAVPSLYEGSCTALAESLHCGVPVVAFDMPFWKGLYDGAALLVPPRDPLALAGGIRRAIADRKLRGELVRKGRGPGRRYTMERTLCSYLRLYESLS